MNYVLNTLKAEIKSLKTYIEYCKDRINVFGLDKGTEAKYKKEIRTNRKRIQDFRDAINLIKEYRKSERQ